jgi:iron(III) transport system ATP-binding protein
VVGNAAEPSLAAIRLSDGQTLTLRVGSPMPPGTKVVVALRPERIALHSTAHPEVDNGANVLAVKVVSRSYLGARFQYRLSVGGDSVKVESLDEINTSEAWIGIPREGSQVFVGNGKAGAAY